MLAPGSVEIAGRLLVSDPVGVDLYRVDGPIVLLTHVAGLYPNDTWSGPAVTYQRVDCTAGRLAVRLQGDPRLFTRPQTVVATEGGAVVGRATIPVNSETSLTVPLRPAADGRCTVRFTVGHTLVPARVEPGSSDTRPLGAHFLDFLPLP